MADLNTSIILRLKSDLARKARRDGDALEKMGRRGKRAMRGIGAAAGAVGKRLKGMANRYTALFSLAGLAVAARQMAGIEVRFERLGVQARRSKEEMKSLHQKILNISKEEGIRVDPGELTAGVEKIVEKTGDLGLAEENLRNMAVAIQATGASGADIGALIADMQQKFGLSGKDAFLAALDMLVKQGKLGAFTLQAMSTQAERLTAAYAATGRRGPEAVREM
ncbi:MAG: tail tape measure protein, partial [Candidatus Glassbacteria bacterium]|nr:tail tape measure protein [Candidatus Glassbacteria bacterium]